jgi:phage shock protein PspC (stress-responsive transcriptional regulator)
MSQNMSSNKITRSVKHKKIAGVCSGIALSKGWSISMTRLAALLLSFATGFGLIFYILFWIFLPKAKIESDSLPNDRLLRDSDNKIVGGVCGAVANYLDWDPAMVRIAFAALILFGGVGLVPYLYAWFVVPLKSPQSLTA